MDTNDAKNDAKMIAKLRRLSSATDRADGQRARSAAQAAWQAHRAAMCATGLVWDLDRGGWHRP